MKHRITKILPLILATIFSISTLFFIPVYADDVCNNPQVSSEIKAASGCGGDANQLPDVITSIVRSVIFVLGIVAAIFIIVGGIQYITSSGDAGKLKKAKDTILYACIGLVICALAFVIINFVIDSILKQ